MESLASRQAGAVSRSQLLGLGVTHDQIAFWIGDGRLVRVHQGVYTVGHARADWPSRHHAALLAAGTAAALFRRSAAITHDLPVDPPEIPELIVWDKRVVRRPALTIHRSTTLDPDRDLTVLAGVRTTTIARTLVDLAGVLSPTQLERAAERAAFRGMLDRGAVIAAAERAGRAKGAAKLRRVLGVELTGSALERNALEALLEAGVTAPRHQHRIRLADGARVRVDFAWPEHRVVLEVDGPHHQQPLFRRKDAERDRALTAAGWRVVRLRYDQDPAVVCALLPQRR